MNLAGNMKLVTQNECLIPIVGKWAVIYRAFFLFHKTFVLFYVPINAAFIRTPSLELLYIDFYLDFVFLLEIIATFFMPFTNEDQRLETNHKKIAKKYLTSYFIIDCLIMFPASLFRYRSRDWQNSKNE